MFTTECRDCPRLAAFLDRIKDEYPNYHARPVAPFGAEEARLLIVGLAPGLHGANATGRPFTGDFAGILLYETLHKYGFSNRPTSVSREDDLRLINCRITNAVKCLPPQNKPVGDEISSCNKYLSDEIKVLHDNSVIVALGSIAHNAVLKALSLKLSGFKFGHNKLHKLPGGLQLLDSYHCSRYNTQTKRLTEKMFHEVFARARTMVDGV